jgi:hypothetical protein
MLTRRVPIIPAYNVCVCEMREKTVRHGDESIVRKLVRRPVNPEGVHQDAYTCVDPQARVPIARARRKAFAEVLMDVDYMRIPRSFNFVGAHTRWKRG